MNSREVRMMYKASLFICVIIVAAFLADLPLCAQMTEVSEDELSLVSAQAGINMNIGNSNYRITADSIRYSDTDTDHDPHNWLEFNDFALGGPGGYFSLDCPVDYPITMDVGTITTIDGRTRTLLEMQLSHHVEPRTWEVGSLVFVNQDLGSLLIDTSTVDPSIFCVSPHLGEGTSGIDFEYLTKWRTEDFTYTYNADMGGAFHVSGINIAGSASGDPSAPDTWEFTERFMIGDLYGGQIDVDNDPSNQDVPNPATMNIATITDENGTNTSMFLNLPMKGTVRMANVNFGGTDYGPIAIDGITVHHLGIRYNPGY